MELIEEGEFDTMLPKECKKGTPEEELTKLITGSDLVLFIGSPTDAAS